MAFKNYVFKNLWLQVALSLIIGLVVELVLGNDVSVGLGDGTLDTLTSYLKIPANIFLSVIQMIIVLLIFASIIVAITNLGVKDKLKTLVGCWRLFCNYYNNCNTRSCVSCISYIPWQYSRSYCFSRRS